MILYNITINIEKDFEEQWLYWIKNHHIPAIMKTGFFTKNSLYKLLNEEEDNSGTTYSLQFFTDSIANVNYFLQNYAQDFMAEHHEKFKNKYVAFMTLLEES